MGSAVNAMGQALDALSKQLDASYARNVQLFDVADRLRATLISAIEQQLRPSKGVDAQMIARHGSEVVGDHPQWVMDGLKVLRECEDELGIRLKEPGNIGPL